MQASLVLGASSHSNRCVCYTGIDWNVNFARKWKIIFSTDGDKGRARGYYITLYAEGKTRRRHPVVSWCGLQCTGVPISLQLSLALATTRTCSIINSFRWQQKIQLEEPNGT